MVNTLTPGPLSIFVERGSSVDVHPGWGGADLGAHAGARRDGGRGPAVCATGRGIGALRSFEGVAFFLVELSVALSAARQADVLAEHTALRE